MHPAELGNPTVSIVGSRQRPCKLSNAIMNKNSLTVSVFQFEEKLIESLEDLDKLRHGKKLNSSNGEDLVAAMLRFEYQQGLVCAR